MLSGSNFWGNHPLGRSILGTPREYSRLFGADTIKTFFQRFYHPERIVISLAGNVEHDRMVDAGRPDLRAYRNGNPLPERTTPQLQPTTKIHNRAPGTGACMPRGTGSCGDRSTPFCLFPDEYHRRRQHEFAPVSGNPRKTRTGLLDLLFHRRPMWIPACSAYIPVWRRRMSPRPST